MKSIFDIHKKLGLVLEKEDGTTIVKEGLITINDNISDYKSNIRTEYSLKKINPHSFFLFNNEPLLLFFDNPPNIQELSENIWNFNKSALVFVNTPKELVIYNGFNFDKDKGLLQVLETIKSFPDYPKLEQYSYWKIVTAELWNAKDKDFKKNTRVDKKLLENIKTARNILLGKDKKSKIKKSLQEKHVNRIIGRLIFVRYLIDRGVKFDYKKEGVKDEEIKEVIKLLKDKDTFPELIRKKEKLYNFFEYLLGKFKGDILPLNGERDAVQKEHLDILANLFAGEDIKKSQRSLFNVFNFDFIPIELISNIYETFLTEIQDADKAFYTPPFLVDYVLSQTVKPHLAKQKNPNRISCKTADMTCGSGIFLCETLRSVINKYIELAKPDTSSEEFKEKIKNLLKENVFGNDINKEATEIAKFSLFITLLDYFEDPKDIENFEFPDVKENFHNEDVFGYFNEDKNFNDKLGNVFGKGKKHELDFIIGNPPWGKLEKESKYIEYCKFRENKENKKKKELWLKENENLNDFETVEIKIGNNEFAQAFLLRLSDFSTEKTENQVIVTSKLLYNLQANKFRNYFLTNFLINEVLEISSVRHQIFANAVGPAAIIKYKYAFSKDTRKNTIDYVSLKPNPYFAIFKTILIEKYDYKEVVQKELIDNDWLWKVLVYGHILDYHFIKRLRNKKEFPVLLGDLIEDRGNKDRPLFASTGIMLGQKKIYDISNYIGMYFINTDTKKSKKKSDLERFHISYDNENTWFEKKVDRKKEKRIFKLSPSLLIKIGFTTDFKLVCSISHITCIFTKAIYAIKSKNKDSEILENLLGLISSELMTFYMIMNGSSTGVEREQLINKELYPFPILENNKISELSKELIKIKRLLKIYEHITVADCEENINIKKAKYERLFGDTEKKLNETIFELYNLSETERDLIDYSLTITIPIIRTKSPKYLKEIRSGNEKFIAYDKPTKQEITNYINIFKEHFSKIHKGGENGYFNVRIFQSTNILAIEFYIADQQNADEWNNEPNNETALEIIASAGFQKVSNELFIQKDVKVLKEKSFSVLKLNQYKYWHKAIARLDLNEFVDAMIKSQKKSTNAKS